MVISNDEEATKFMTLLRVFLKKYINYIRSHIIWNNNNILINETAIFEKYGLKRTLNLLVVYIIIELFNNFLYELQVEDVFFYNQIKSNIPTDREKTWKPRSYKILD